MATRSAIFFGLMAAASVVTVGKLGIVAALLPAESFAFYASAFAASGFVVSALSLGLVESTPKKYTRWIARGRFDAVVADLGLVLRTLALRTLALIVSGLCVIAFFFAAADAVTMVAVMLIGLAMNAYSTIGSILRGLDRLLFLGGVSVLRALIAAGAVASVGYWGGWRAGLMAEALVIVTLGAVLVLLLHRQLQAAASRSPRPGDMQPLPEMEDHGGHWLFLAYLLASVPMSLDRWAIITFDSTDVAGQYAFLAIWVIGAFTVASIYIQKFGPDIIRRREADPSARLLRLTLLHMLAAALLIAGGSALSFAALYLFFPELFWLKYALTPSVAVAATLAATCQVTPLLDWALIALDGEKAVLAASFAFVGVTVVGFVAIALLGWGAGGYLTMLALGRLAQASIQMAAVARRQPR